MARTLSHGAAPASRDAAARAALCCHPMGGSTESDASAGTSMHLQSCHVWMGCHIVSYPGVKPACRLLWQSTGLIFHLSRNRQGAQLDRTMYAP